MDNSCILFCYNVQEFYKRRSRENKMKKKLLALIVAGAVFATVTACSGTGENNTEPAGENGSAVTDENSETDEEINSDVSGEEREITSLDEIRENYIFTLDNTEYQLPCGVTEFTSNGWDYPEEYQGGTLEAMSYTDVQFAKGETSLTLRVINTTDADKAIDDCQIAAITVQENTGVSFSTGKDIHIGSSLADVKEKYGTYKYGFYEDEISLSYDFSRSYEFYLKADDDFSFDVNIDGINEQSLNADTLKFLASEETGKVNEIYMEYYPAE